MLTSFLCLDCLFTSGFLAKIFMAFVSNETYVFWKQNKLKHK